MISTIYERLMKAKSLIGDIEKFDIFVSTILVFFCNDRKLEQNIYEDIVRLLAGKDAYLLFVFEKLIATVSIYNFNFRLLKTC